MYVRSCSTDRRSKGEEAHVHSISATDVYGYIVPPIMRKCWQRRKSESVAADNQQKHWIKQRVAPRRYRVQRK